MPIFFMRYNWRKIFLVMMLLWMAGIFAFSSRSGDESAEDSYLVGTMVGDIFVPGFDEWSAEKQQAFAEKIDHPVRKTAHATEYAILGLLAAGVSIPEVVGRRDEKTMSEEVGYSRTTKSEYAKIRRELLIPWGIAALYAATDEFHQLFVPGRSGQFSDVILDSAGALARLLILALVIKIIGRRRNSIERDTK